MENWIENLRHQKFWWLFWFWTNHRFTRKLLNYIWPLQIKCLILIIWCSRLCTDFSESFVLCSGFSVLRCLDSLRILLIYFYNTVTTALLVVSGRINFGHNHQIEDLRFLDHHFWHFKLSIKIRIAKPLIFTEVINLFWTFFKVELFSWFDIRYVAYDMGRIRRIKDPSVGRVSYLRPRCHMETDWLKLHRHISRFPIH